MDKTQKQVRDFNRKFGLPSATDQYERGPLGRRRLRVLPEKEVEFRYNFLKEEVVEFLDAAQAEDVAGMIDALCDIIYVAYGTAEYMQVDLEPFMDEVHRSNMAKVLPVGIDPQYGRNKITKPEGWEPPRILELLALHYPTHRWEHPTKAVTPGDVKYEVPTAPEYTVTVCSNIYPDVQPEKKPSKKRKAKK